MGTDAICVPVEAGSTSSEEHGPVAISPHHLSPPKVMLAPELTSCTMLRWGWDRRTDLMSIKWRREQGECDPILYPSTNCPSSHLKALHKKKTYKFLHAIEARVSLLSVLCSCFHLWHRRLKHKDRFHLRALWAHGEVHCTLQPQSPSRCL